MINNKRKKIAQVSIALGLLMGLCFACSNEMRLPYGSDMRKFDAEVWKEDSSLLCQKIYNSNSNVILITERQKMTEDLVGNVLPGKSRDEIEQILGFSLSSIKSEDFSRTTNPMIYYMGPERYYIPIDSEWLLIWIDNYRKFKKYGIVND